MTKWKIEPFTKGIKRTTPHNEKIPLSFGPLKYSLSPDEVGEVATGLGHRKQSSPVQLKEQIRGMSTHAMKL